MLGKLSSGPFDDVDHYIISLSSEAIGIAATSSTPGCLAISISTPILCQLNWRTPLGVVFHPGVYVSLYERPGCQVPRHPLSIFLSSCALLSFVRPRRRLSPAPTAYCRRPARADAVKAGRPSAATPSGGPRPLQQSSTTAGLMGRVDYTPVYYLSVFVSGRVIPMADVF